MNPIQATVVGDMNECAPIHDDRAITATLFQSSKIEIYGESVTLAIVVLSNLKKIENAKLLNVKFELPGNMWKAQFELHKKN